MSIYEFYYTTPVIYAPSRREMDLMFAQSLMRESIRREIESDADKLWQQLLRTERLRSLSAEDVTTACKWWFQDGYNEHVNFQAKRIYVSEIVGILANAARMGKGN